jgi:phage gpG-like protein
MANIVIKVDVSGLESKLAAVQEQLHPAGLLDAIGQRWLQWINDNFESEGGKVGGWAPLADSTVAARRGGAGQILQDTGVLRESFDYEVMGDSQVRVGTKVQYASFHEEGTAPYDIVPVTGKVLAFMGANGMVFVRHVHHPGLSQRRMLPNEPEALDMVNELVQARIDMIKEVV